MCLSCNSGAVGDEKHLVFECAALAALLSQYANLFTSCTDTVRSIFAQPDHMGVFHYVVDCLDFIRFDDDCHDWHKRSALSFIHSLINF